MGALRSYTMAEFPDIANKSKAECEAELQELTKTLMSDARSFGKLFGELLARSAELQCKQLSAVSEEIVGKKRKREKRSPSEYNEFIAKEIPRVKSKNPSMSHKEAFTQATANWKNSKTNPKNTKAGTPAKAGAPAKSGTPAKSEGKSETPAKKAKTDEAAKPSAKTPSDGTPGTGKKKHRRGKSPKGGDQGEATPAKAVEATSKSVETPEKTPQASKKAGKGPDKGKEAVKSEVPSATPQKAEQKSSEEIASAKKAAKKAKKAGKKAAAKAADGS